MAFLTPNSELRRKGGEEFSLTLRAKLQVVDLELEVEPFSLCAMLYACPPKPRRRGRYAISEKEGMHDHI